jgi:hypothetical protein
VTENGLSKDEEHFGAGLLETIACAALPEHFLELAGAESTRSPGRVLRSVFCAQHESAFGAVDLKRKPT